MGAARLVLFLFLFTRTAAAGELVGRVTAGGKNVRDAVLFIEGVRAGSPPARPVVIDQQRRKFIPHVTAVLVGTAVLFPNNDTVFHNVFSYREGKRFDLGLYPVGATRRPAGCCSTGRGW
jgi:plastocyanin